MEIRKGGVTPQTISQESSTEKKQPIQGETAIERGLGSIPDTLENAKARSLFSEAPHQLEHSDYQGGAIDLTTDEQNNAGTADPESPDTEIKDGSPLLTDGRTKSEDQENNYPTHGYRGSVQPGDLQTGNQQFGTSMDFIQSEYQVDSGEPPPDLSTGPGESSTRSVLQDLAHGQFFSTDLGVDETHGVRSSGDMQSMVGIGGRSLLNPGEKIISEQRKTTKGDDGSLTRTHSGVVWTPGGSIREASRSVTETKDGGDVYTDHYIEHDDKGNTTTYTSVENWENGSKVVIVTKSDGQGNSESTTTVTTKDKDGKETTTTTTSKTTAPPPKSGASTGGAGMPDPENQQTELPEGFHLTQIFDFVMKNARENSPSAHRGGETVNPSVDGAIDQSRGDAALLAQVLRQSSLYNMMGQSDHKQETGSAGAGGSAQQSGGIGGSINYGPDSTQTGWDGTTRTDEASDAQTTHESGDLSYLVKTTDDEEGDESE